MLGNLNIINMQGNQQPSLMNVRNIVVKKVQRLMGEESHTNKPDTSAVPERDDIVRAIYKYMEVGFNTPTITKLTPGELSPVVQSPFSIVLTTAVLVFILPELIFHRR